MKTLGLLFFWTISWLTAGVPDRSPPSGKDLRSIAHVAPAMSRPTGRLPLGRPEGEDLGAFLWDGEDSADGDPGDVLDTGCHLHSPGAADRAALALLALSQGGAVWTSCQRHPLRC